MAKLLIKELCKQQGIPLKIMAGKMGMSPSTFTQFISSANPSIPTLERIAGVLNVNVGDLFERKYARVLGFVATDNASCVINSKEDWVVASQQIDGLAKAPYYADLEALRKAVEKFVKDNLKSRKSASFMAQIGADEIITIVNHPLNVEYPSGEDESFVDYTLTICTGNGVITTLEYSTLEYRKDLKGMIQEIWNDVEAIFEDTNFGEELK